MSVRAFVDTNIVIYAFTGQGRKRAVAGEIVASQCWISVQVLNEFAAVCKGKLSMAWPEIERGLDLVRDAATGILALTEPMHETAMDLARRHHLKIYDACIVAAALEAGCDTLWSEDLQAGRRFGNLTIRNPFEGA